MGNYSSLSKSDFNSTKTFGNLDWDIGSVNSNYFYIELKNVDAASCNRFINSIADSISLEVNGFTSQDIECSNNSDIRWVFDQLNL